MQATLLEEEADSTDGADEEDGPPSASACFRSAAPPVKGELRFRGKWPLQSKRENEWTIFNHVRTG